MKISAWPRGMRTDIAATYVGLSESSFLAEVKKKNIPDATWITKGRKIWLREQLDQWLDEKAGNPTTWGSENEWMDAVRNENQSSICIRP